MDNPNPANSPATSPEGFGAAAEVIAGLAERAACKPTILTTKDGREFLVGPDSDGRFAYEDITPPNSVAEILPDHIAQVVTLQTVAALGEYVGRFRTENTVLLGDVAANRIVALIDYHGPDKADRGAHQAILTLPFSVEYQTWAAIDGQLLPQLEFARFLEENAPDIKAPSGADLLEVCRDLQARRQVNFKKAVRTASDNENFEYTDETTAAAKNGAIEIPNRFLLGIPIYFGDAQQELGAFLRWTLVGTELHLGIKLHRLEHVRQAVFQQHLLTIADRTERPGYLGRLGG